MRKNRGPKIQEPKEFEQSIIDLARVTRVMAGGKRMRFRACVAIGDGKGKVGIGIAKGADVTLAINKAVNRAKKKMIVVPIVNETIPHEIREKFKAARIMLKPAPSGTGVKAGGTMRVLLELAGVPNVVGKMMGTGNKVTNVKATMNAFERLKKSSEMKSDLIKKMVRKPKEMQDGKVEMEHPEAN